MRTRTGPRKTVAEALLPEARRKVLGILLLEPEQRWHLRALARRTGLSPSAVQREVVSLVDVGILQRHAEPRRTYYQANTNCPIYSELRSLVLKTVGLVDLLREALNPLKKIRVAFVYGSIARGDETAESDIDIVVIGDITFAEVVERLHLAQRSLSREVNPTVYSTREFRERVAAGHHFATNLLQEPKLFILGDGDVLDRLAGPGPAEKTLLKPRGNQRTPRPGRS